MILKIFSYICHNFKYHSQIVYKMNFSKTTEYIIRILTFMAISEKELISARYLHEELKIPYKYLTNLLHRLSENKYLYPVQGKYGGYKFLKSPKDIVIFDIIEDFDGEETFTSCVLGLQNCSDENPCVLHGNWSEIRKQVVSVFKNTTIENLKDQKNLRITDMVAAENEELGTESESAKKKKRMN